MTPKRGDAPAALLAFDMDGVLVDVSRSFRVAIASTVAALGGPPVAPGEVQGLKNQGGYNNDWDLTHELLRRRGIAVDYARVVEVFHSLYRRELIQQETWRLPAPLLAALGGRYRLAIFTGRPRQDAEFSLRLFGCAAAFAQVVALEDVERQKPAPDGLLRLAREHAPLPLAGYIGDSVDDARCALAAGVPFHPVFPAGLDDPAQRALLASAFAALGCDPPADDVAAVARRLLA